MHVIIWKNRRISFLILLPLGNIVIPCKGSSAIITASMVAVSRLLPHIFRPLYIHVCRGTRKFLIVPVREGSCVRISMDNFLDAYG